MTALIAGDDGLDDLRIITSGAAEWLVPGGLLVTEIGHTQAPAVMELYQVSGFTGVEVHKDLAGRDRFVSGVRS